MPLNFHPGPGVLMAFPTPIIRGVWSAGEEHNARLREMILAKEKEDPGIERSNVGTWHSDGNLIAWGGDAIESWHRWIGGGVKRITELGADLDPDQKISVTFEATAWANVCRNGGYNREHSHPSSVWSGCYYVSTGTPDPNYPEAGIIEFTDPRFNVEAVQPPGQPWGTTVKITPEPRMVLLWPAWLRHSVNAYYGSEERISIAFNVMKVSLETK